MEFALRRSGQGGEIVKEEKRSESNGGDDHEAPHKKQETTVVKVPPKNTTERSIVETLPTTASATKKEEVDELECARAEMGEVREENQRLKTLLDRIMKEYQALQMQFQVIVQQETKESANHNHEEQTEESEMVFLSLGRVPGNPKSQEKNKVSSKPMSLQQEEELKQDDLALGLDCKFETSKSGSTTEALPNPSPTNSSEVPKEEAAESWPPSKVLKATASTDQDEVSQQNPAKKARVCVRARCDTPTMNDGCQWRKYGQKISKGNPCPRAYYRCTVAPNCPVRKQVQRCAEDMSILITTYEGTHNHPLPLSATAMASTTSAAVSMLLSGSSSTSHHPAGSIPPSSTSTAATTTASDLHGLNFYLSDGIGSKPKQFYLSNPALSPSPSHPTITLDLTTSNPSSSNRFTSNYINPPPRFPASTSLSFSSSESNALSWGNSNGFLTYNYNTHVTQPYNNSNNNRSMNILGNSINLGRQLSMPIPTPSAQTHQNSSLPDTIAAATKVITADPTFQSALAAALTSIIGTGSSVSSNSGIGISTQGVGENLGHINKSTTKWGELFPAAAASTNSKVNGCASSFLNKTTSSASTQTANSSLTFLPPSLPFSSSKSASALSPGDNRDNSNS